MATHGNLELRIVKGLWIASTTHDGDNVYEAIPKFAEFLDSVKNPTKEQLYKWFKRTSKELLPYNYSRSLMGGVPEEVVIDVPRKLILHTDYEERYSDYIPKRDSSGIQKACDDLKAKHGFEILKYTHHLMRAVKK